MPLPLLAIMLRPWAWLIVATKILLQNLCKYQISKGPGHVTVAGCLLADVSAAGCGDQLVKAAAVAGGSLVQQQVLCGGTRRVGGEFGCVTIH